MTATEGRIKPQSISSTRYPYTYACDFLREHVTDFNEMLGFQTPSISRGQASQVMHALEKVFGLSHEDMAKKLADYALAQGATE